MWRYRSDADLVKDAPLTRRVMPLIMRKRNESAVFFTQTIDPRKAQKALKAFSEQSGTRATFTHLFAFATARTLHRWPRLNRFTAGGRLWQRRGVWISFSAKTTKDHDGFSVVVKKRIEPNWSFADLIEGLEKNLQQERTDKKSRTLTELKLLFAFPHFISSFIGRVLMWADQMGLLPASVIEGDPMYASCFLANLGSIKMDAAHHHLYEYGTIPIFMVASGIQNVVVDKEGTPSVQPRMTFKYTFDERVEDGLYCAQALEEMRQFLEDPQDLLDEAITEISEVRTSKR